VSWGYAGAIFFIFVSLRPTVDDPTTVSTNLLVLGGLTLDNIEIKPGVYPRCPPVIL